MSYFHRSIFCAQTSKKTDCLWNIRNQADRWLQGRDKGPPNAPSHTQTGVPILLSCPAIYHCNVLTSVSQHDPSEVIIKHGSAGTAAMAATPAQGGIHYHCQHITNHTQYPQMWQISCCISSSVCWSVSTLHQVTSDV